MAEKHESDGNTASDVEVVKPLPLHVLAGYLLRQPFYRIRNFSKFWIKTVHFCAILRAVNAIAKIILEWFQPSVGEVSKLTSTLTQFSLLVTALLAMFGSVGQVQASESGDFAAMVVESARDYLKTPYRFGSTGKRGLDCSAFVQRVFSDNGIALPRTVKKQVAAKNTGWVGNPRPGDLVFFKNTYKRGYSHVGVYVGGNKMIHASTSGGKILETSLDNPYFKKHFAGFRRVTDRGYYDSSPTMTALSTSNQVRGTYDKRRPIPFWLAAAGGAAGVIGGVLAPSAQSKTYFAAGGLAAFSLGVVWGNKTRFRLTPGAKPQETARAKPTN